MLLHGHEMTLPQLMKRKTVSFDLGEQSEADLADTLGPLHSTHKTVLDNIGHAQSKQAAQYAKRQLQGELPSQTVQDKPSLAIFVRWNCAAADFLMMLPYLPNPAIM